MVLSTMSDVFMMSLSGKSSPMSDMINGIINPFIEIFRKPVTNIWRNNKLILKSFCLQNLYHFLLNR
jgi:hypothetical protein